MTRDLDCRCGHTIEQHQQSGLAPQCAGAGCSCLQYRNLAPGGHVQGPDAPAALTSAVTSAPTPAPGGSSEPVGDLTVGGLIKAGRRSESKRIVALAEKVAGLVEQLREQLNRETEMAAALQEIAALEAKLAKAKQKIARPTKVRRAGPEPVTGEHACSDCDRTFPQAQGLGMHRMRAHGHRKEAAS